MVERYKGVEVEGVYPGASPIVQFYTGGRGLVPSAAYWGFYYSESGQPAAYQKKQEHHRQKIQVAFRHGDQQQDGREQEEQLGSEKGIVGSHGVRVGPGRPLHHLGEVVEIALVPAKGAEGPVEYLDNAHAVDVLHDGTLHPLLGVMEFHLKSCLVRPFQAGGEQTYGEQEGKQGHDGQSPVHSK